MYITNSLKILYFFAAGICFTSQLTACSGKEESQNKSKSVISKSEDILVPDKTILLPGVKGRIDHMDIDVKGQILFVAAIGNNSVELVDLQKSERANEVKDIDEPQGVVFIPSNNTICVSSGGSGACNFYDAKTLSIQSSVNIGPDADNLRYNAIDKLIFAGFGDGGIAVLDAIKQSLLSKTTFEGHPEAFQSEKSGSRIFVNVPSAKSILLIDNKINSVINSWRISNASSNFPIALDETNHCLFTGCRKPSVIIVYDTELLKELARLDIKDDVDDIYFDIERKLLYVSCGEGYLQVYKQEDKNTYRNLQDIETSKGARTCLFVPELKKIFVAAPRTGDSEARIYVYKIKH